MRASSVQGLADRYVDLVSLIRGCEKAHACFPDNAIYLVKAQRLNHQDMQMLEPLRELTKPLTNHRD